MAKFDILAMLHAVLDDSDEIFSNSDSDNRLNDELCNDRMRRVWCPCAVRQANMRACR
jgi:hypothetical protein